VEPSLGGLNQARYELHAFAKKVRERKEGDKRALVIVGHGEPQLRRALVMAAAAKMVNTRLPQLGWLNIEANDVVERMAEMMAS
jgi:hypothetical protein